MAVIVIAVGQLHRRLPLCFCFCFVADVPIDARQIHVMEDAVRLRRDRFLHVAPGFRPAGGVEDFSAQEILGEQASEAVQSHHFGVPHPHHVQAARLPGIDLEALESFVAHILRILDSRPRPLTESVLAEGAGEIEMTLGVTGVCFDCESGVEFRGLEV